MEYTAGVLGILNIFGLDDPADKLAHENAVDSPTNLITLTSSLHSDFDHLKIWFDETEVRSTYIAVSTSANFEYADRKHLHY